LAALHNATNSFEKALEFSSKAVVCAPHNPDLYSDRAAVFLKKGDIDRALQDYSYAIMLNPANAGYYNYRGLLYQKAGDVKSAMEDFNRGLRIDSLHAEILYNLGNAFLMLHQPDRAIGFFGRALENPTPCHDAIYGICSARCMKGHYKIALYALNKMLKKNPRDAKALPIRGNAYLETGFVKEALADYENALRAGAEPVNLYYNIGLCHEKLGSSREAIGAYGKFLAAAESRPGTEDLRKEIKERMRNLEK
jgi:tetratricopeptide (TPR) repeat protein